MTLPEPPHEEPAEPAELPGADAPPPQLFPDAAPGDHPSDGSPAYYPPPPVSARRPSRDGIILLSIVAAVVVVIMVVAAVFFVRSLKVYKVSLPATVAGMPKDPTANTSAYSNAFGAMLALDNSLADQQTAAYRDPADYAMVVIGVAQGTDINVDAFAAGIRQGLTNVGFTMTDVAPGPHGGKAWCATGVSSTGAEESTCGWVTTSSLGMFYGPPGPGGTTFLDETILQPMLVKIRNSVEKAS